MFATAVVLSIVWFAIQPGTAVAERADRSRIVGVSGGFGGDHAQRFGYGTLNENEQNKIQAEIIADAIAKRLSSTQPGSISLPTPPHSSPGLGRQLFDGFVRVFAMIGFVTAIRFGFMWFHARHPLKK